MREAAADKAVTPSTADGGEINPAGPSIAAASAAMTAASPPAPSVGVEPAVGATATSRAEEAALREEAVARTAMLDGDGAGADATAAGAIPDGSDRTGNAGAAVDSTCRYDDSHDTGVPSPMEARDRLRLLSMEMELQRAWLASYLDDKEVRAARRRNSADLASTLQACSGHARCGWRHLAWRPNGGAA